MYAISASANCWLDPIGSREGISSIYCIFRLIALAFHNRAG